MLYTSAVAVSKIDTLFPKKETFCLSCHEGEGFEEVTEKLQISTQFWGISGVNAHPVCNAEEEKMNMCISQWRISSNTSSVWMKHFELPVHACYPDSKCALKLQTVWKERIRKPLMCLHCPPRLAHYCPPMVRHWGGCWFGSDVGTDKVKGSLNCVHIKLFTQWKEIKEEWVENPEMCFCSLLAILLPSQKLWEDGSNQRAEWCRLEAKAWKVQRCILGVGPHWRTHWGQTDCLSEAWYGDTAGRL